MEAGKDGGAVFRGDLSKVGKLSLEAKTTLKQ